MIAGSVICGERVRKLPAVPIIRGRGALGAREVFLRLSFRLAVRAEVGRPRAEDDAADGGFAAGAGFGLAVVDAVDFLEVAWVSVGVAVVAEGAAAVVDGAVQDFFDRPRKAADLLTAEAVGGSSRVDAGIEQGFIRVDVADAGEEFLIEQRGFDGAPRLFQQRGECFWGEGEGFGTKIGVGGFLGGKDEESAEAAGVGEAQLLARYVEDQMGVGEQGRSVTLQGQAAGHAEMDKEAEIVVEGEDDFLAAAVQGLDRAILQEIGEVGGRRIDDVGAEEVDGGDLARNDRGGQTADDGFDLGQFGHG